MLTDQIKQRLGHGKGLLRPIGRPRKSSNLSGSTFNDLIYNRLETITDQKTDQVKTRWEGPFIYEPPGGDLKRDWFVWIKYQHPITGEMQRFRYNMGFSEYGTKAKRREHAKLVRDTLEEILKDGYSPFDELDLTAAPPEDKSVASCIVRYLNEIEPNVRPNTYKKYKVELLLFKRWLEEQNLIDLAMSDVNRAVVSNFLKYYRDLRKWSGKTYNSYLNDITTFFNYFHLNYDDFLDKVPSKPLKRIPAHRPGNKAFNDWQFKRLKELMLENGDEFLYTFCSFIYYAALRNEAEGIYIKAEDFNFNTGTLRVESGSAKNRKTEYIPIYPEFMDLLLRLGVDKMPGNYYIFGKNGIIGHPERIGIDFLARRFRKYKKELNLEPRQGIYCYKHTRGLHLGEDGEDLYKIMKLFRHGDLATTMIYLRDLGINVQQTEFEKGRSF